MHVRHTHAHKGHIIHVLIYNYATLLCTFATLSYTCATLTDIQHSSGDGRLAQVPARRQEWRQQ